MKMPRAVYVILACISLGACSDSTAAVCNEPFGSPAIALVVRDAQTGMPILGQITVLDSTGHSYAESSTFTTTALDDTLYVGDGPGTYELDVQTAGYSEWRRSGIVIGVEQFGCHRLVTNISAALTREP